MNQYIGMSKGKVITLVVIVLIIVAGAFFGGTKYAETKAAARGTINFQNLSPEERQARFAQFGNGMGNGGQRNGMGSVRSGDGLGMGEVMKIDGSQITLKLADGGSKIIFVSTSTQVLKTETALLSDIQVGANISINGERNQDGSITARSVQLRNTSN